MLQGMRYDKSSADTIPAELGIVDACEAPDPDIMDLDGERSKQFPSLRYSGNCYPIVTENYGRKSMEGVEWTLPAIEREVGLSANLDGRSPKTTSWESKATAQDAAVCYTCSALFSTSEELRSHVRFYQVRIRMSSGNRADAL